MRRGLVIVLALTSLAAAGMLLRPKAAGAQDQSTTYYTYVSEWAVPRTQWAAFARQDQASIAHMKQLIADGTLVFWGNEETRVHSSGGFTHAEWFTATSRANLLKALESQWNTAVNPSYASATKHSDLFLHSIAYGGKSGQGSGYLRVASYQAKDGQEDTLEGVLMTKMKPFLDSQISKGNLAMYTIDKEEIHTDMPGGYDIAMVFPDGATMDRFYDDFAALEKSDAATGQAFANMTVAANHRDDFGRVTAYQNK